MRGRASRGALDDTSRTNGDVGAYGGGDSANENSGDDDPLELEVTEQAYGVRAPSPFTDDELEQNRRQFRVRLARLTRGGDAELSDSLALARWAADKGIPDLYGLALRYTSLIHSGDRETRRRLKRLRLSLRRLPVDREAGTQLLANLGPDFRLLRTPHFRLAYDTEEPFARKIGALLERVHRAFFRFFKARHFEPVPPADRLEVVIFARRADYHRVTQHLGSHLASTSGVFVGKDNRTYFFDALSEPGIDRSHQNIADSIQSLRRFLKDIQGGTAGRRFNLTVGGERYVRVDAARAQQLLRAEVTRLQRQKRQINRRYAGRNTSRAVHEIVHHLAYAAGIHGRFRKSPTWLIEGLAMYFESVHPRTGRWLGPGATNQARQRSFRRDKDARREVSLHELASSDQGFRQGGKAMNRTYNAAWALFHYLVTNHQDALFDLMANLSIEVATDRPTPASRRQELTRVFGPFSTLQQRWLRSF